MLIKLKLLKDWSNAGTDYKSGTEIEMDSKAYADSLVESGVAEILDTDEGAEVKVVKSAETKDETKDEDKPRFTKAELEMVAKAAFSEAAKTVTLGRAPVDVKVVKENIEDDPAKGFKSPKQFLKAVIDAEMYGMDNAPAGLKMLRVSGSGSKAAGSDEAMTISDAYGGFLVPERFSPELMKVDFEGDPTQGMTQSIPMEGPLVRIPARTDKVHTSSVSGGLQVSRSVETAAKTATRGEFEQIVMNARPLFGFAHATEELLTDSPMSFVAILEAGFRDEFAATILDEKLNGSGVGKYEGVLNAPCTVSIAKETGQAATSIVYENIVKMRARNWGFSNSIWLANHDTIPQLMLMNQAVGTGGVVVWQPSAREDHPDLLLGRPIFFSEWPKTLGTVGDIVLGNWTQYLEGVYQPLQSAESIHVRFSNHERTFKFWMRNDGRCWWRTAITPKRGSSLSPFITLATRA